MESITHMKAVENRSCETRLLSHKERPANNQA